VGEATDQKAYTESDGRRCVGTLLYCRAHEIIGIASALAHGLRGVDSRLLRLSIQILEGAFRLLCRALDLAFDVPGRSPKSCFHLATEIPGSASQPIFVHEHVPCALFLVWVMVS
jgi:hypothetical protein